MGVARLSRRSAILAVLFMAAGASLLADSRIEREFALQPGGALALDTDRGSVEVIGTSASVARVVITSRRDDIESFYTIDFEESSERLGIRVEKRGKISSWFNWSKSPDLHFRIEVPRRTELNVDTSGGAIRAEAIEADVRLDTSGGSIHVENVDGDVEADTSGGNVEIAGVRGDVSADTSGGSIRIDEVSGSVSADTSGGSIRINEATGRVVASTSGGSVEVSFAAGNSSGGELSTSGGGIHVRLDPSVGLSIDASVSGGSVETDIPMTVRGEVSRSSLRGEMGSGGATLRLRTSGGKIRIDPR